MLFRVRDEATNTNQHDQLRSLSPTTGKSDIPSIKGKKIKNNIINIKKINLNSKPPKSKKNSDYQSIVQQEGIRSDRYHYQLKQNSIIEQTKRKRRKSALSFIEGNATQKQRIEACSYFDDRFQERSGNLRPTKTWTNPHKLKSKHFFNNHNQSIKSTPRTFLDSQVVKKSKKKTNSINNILKETSIQNLKKLITKMIDQKLDKKLMKNFKQLSTTKIIEKRKVKKSDSKKKDSEGLVLKIKDLKTMTNSLIPSSDTVEDINYETEKKYYPQKNTNLQTTQSLAILKKLVNISYCSEIGQKQDGTVQDLMASKIKKAWKNYRTHKIINQYASLFMQDQQNQGPFQQYQKQISGEHFSLNNQSFNTFNQRGRFDNRFQPANNLKDNNHRDIQRPNNIPSKRNQIKDLKDALEFIKYEMNIESPNTILHNLMNSIQEQLDIEDEDEQLNQNNQEEPTTKNKEKPSEVDSQRKKQLMSLFENDLIQSEGNIDSDDQKDEKWDVLTNTMDLNLIGDGFQKRQKSLISKKQKQLKILEIKLKENKISQKQYKEKSSKLQDQTYHELLIINRVKKSLHKGLLQAESILNKNKEEIPSSKLQNDPELKKCLSNEYIRHVNIDSFFEPSPNIQAKNSEQLKRLRKQLDIANNKQKSFPSDQQFFSEELKLIEDQKQYNSDSATETQRKLRDLDIDDKDDIFQFAFLDLCIQFCQQIYCEQQNMKIAMDFIKKSRKKPKQKNKGIKTNINTVKEYLKQLKAYLNRTNKSVYQKIRQPLGPTAKEMLKYMHYSEEQFKQKDDYDLGSTLILGTSLFQNFQNNFLPGIEIEPYYTDQTKQKNRVKFLKDVIHIHNKAVFDCLNESLDLERPFGMWGAPFPWKTTSKFLPLLNMEDLESKYVKAEEKVIQCCSYFCGLLVDKQQSLVSPGSKISQQYLQQVKQDRLSRMLAADLLQGEERWMFYDDEETESLVQISQIIYELLVRQSIQEFKSLFLPFQML